MRTKPPTNSCPVSLEVVAACGGGTTKQTVSMSGDPLRWLESRLRRAIVPCPYGHRHGIGLRSIPERAAAFERRALAALAKLPIPRSNATTGGRPVRRDPTAFASWLGVSPKEADSLGDVLSRWTRTHVDALLAVAGGRSKWWQDDAARWLDHEWLPRFVRTRHPPLRGDDSDEDACYDA